MPPPRIIVHPMNKTRPHAVTENATFVCVGQGYGFVDVIGGLELEIAMRDFHEANP